MKRRHFLQTSAASLGFPAILRSASPNSMLQVASVGVARDQVMAAADAAQAERAVSALEGRIDLVLTDQNMPRMDGINLTKNLRNHPKANCG